MNKQNKPKFNIHIWLLYLMICSFLVSGVTFSKYIKSTTAGDGARVAKFGDLTLTEPTKPEKYTFIPGQTIYKNPQINFSANELSAYVFVTIKADNWIFNSAFNRYTYKIDSKFEWEVDATDWTLLEYSLSEKQAVFYKLVPPGQALNVAIIKNNTITVADTIKNSEMTEYEDRLNISFKAYVVQSGGFENAASAWSSVKNKE